MISNQTNRSDTGQRAMEVLLVDDDQLLREDMTRYFSRRGYRVSASAGGEQALALADQQGFDVIVLDIMMPGMNGLEVLRRLKERGSEAEVVMLTGHASVQLAVEAMKLGAREFLTKPISLRNLEIAISSCVETGKLKKENRQLKAVLRNQTGSSSHQSMIGDSPQMQRVFRLIERTARCSDPILIQGESGTGKELVARALHAASPLSDKPLVVINCAALPETLLESELFGHEKGAFTGAVSAKPGLFEVADGGTLFIDEFGELAGPLQAKLLRVMEDGSLRRVGSIKERRVNVRILAATNRDLVKEVAEGRFREDLFYRINVLSIPLPPLRARVGDLPLLVEHLTGPDWRVPDRVMEVFEHYHWPGNVRQLHNALQRAKILGDDGKIRVENLPQEILNRDEALRTPAAPPRCDLESLTRSHIIEAYQNHNGNKARTARALGVGRRSLYRLLEKFQIEDPRNVAKQSPETADA